MSNKIRQLLSTVVFYTNKKQQYYITKQTFEMGNNVIIAAISIF